MPRRSLEEIARRIPEILDFYELATNYGLTWKVVEWYPNQKWCNILPYNPCVTCEIFESSLYPIYRDWTSFSSNPNLTWEFVVKNLDKRWCWYSLSGHRNITWEIVRDNLREASFPMPWDWMFVSENPNITWEIIQANPDKPWHPCFVSSNPNISWDIVQANPDYPWNGECLSNNYNISLETIQKNLEGVGFPIAWSWEILSERQDLTWEFVEAHLDKDWYWDSVSRYARIPLKVIEEFPGINWNWHELAQNPHIPWEFIVAHPEKEWKWSELSRNWTITWVDIIKHELWRHKDQKFSENHFFSDKDYWVWDQGRNWIWFTESEQKEILIALWVLKKWGLDIEIIHIILEEYVKTYW